MKEKKPVFKNNIQKYAPVFLMLVLMVILTIANKNFLSAQSIYNLLQQVSALGIVALGAMIVLLTAGIDFTAVSVYLWQGLPQVMYIWKAEIRGFFLL